MILPDILLSLLLIFNVFWVIYFDNLTNKREKLLDSDDKILKYKLICIIIWITIFAILIFVRFSKIAYLIIYIIGVFGTIWHIFNSKSDMLSDDAVHYYLLASAIYFVFFSYKPLFDISSFFNIPSLKVCEMNIKKILYTFSLIINLFLLLDLIIKILKHKNIKLKTQTWNLNKIEFNIIDRGIYNKKDILLYFFKTPYIILLNILKIAKIKADRIFKKSIIKLCNLIKYILKNRNRLIKLAITVSVLISLLLTYIEVIIDKNQIFSNEIKNIYEMIATVILIPIIFNIIDLLTKKQNN